MRVGIISDIHGNLEALEAVLARCGEIGVERLFCLGDVVGYGADPAACVDLVRARAEFTCAGNHDWAASGRIDTSDFNSVAAEAIAWTRARLSADGVSFLESLPLTQQVDEGFFVHGSPHEPAAFHYIFGVSDAEQAVGEAETALTFVGHSHRGFIYRDDAGEVVAGEGPAPVDGNARYIVNAGSVGQPRDGDARASFCLWDRASETLELVRVPYDVSGAQHKIEERGLPLFLARRLTAGK